MKKIIGLIISAMLIASLLLTACGNEAVLLTEAEEEIEVETEVETEIKAELEGEIEETIIREADEMEANKTDEERIVKDVFYSTDVKYSSLPEGIICWGDSLTEGFGGDGVTYPSTLQNLLNHDGYDIEVVNMGASGEDTTSIAGRSGAIPFLTVNDIYIPEDPVGVEVHLISSNGSRVFPSIFSDIGINECYIGGVAGRLTKWVRASNDADYTFVRSKSGDAVSVPAGSQVVTEASIDYKNYISIVFIGTNGGFKDYNDLIEQQNAIINSRDKDTDRFLIIGITEKTNEDYEEYDRIMKGYYKDKFLDLRDYLVNHALEDAGINPTDDDVACINKGMVPSSIRVDEVHLNAVGYELMGKQVYKRLVELGYFNVEE